MRRNHYVPAKNPLPASHRQGVSKPVSHHSLSALNSFSCSGFERLNKNLPINKDAFPDCEISWYQMFVQITPFRGYSQQLGNFFNFNSEGLGRHNDSCSPTSIFILSQHTEPPHTKTIIFSTQ